MRPLDEVVERLKDVARRAKIREATWMSTLERFIPFERWLEVFPSHPNPEKIRGRHALTRRDLTPEAVIQHMQPRVERAWDNARHCRTESWIEMEDIKAHCWLLCDEEALGWCEDKTLYVPFGAPVLSKVCERFGLPVPDWPAVARAAQALLARHRELSQAVGPLTERNAENALWAQRQALAEALAELREA